MSNEQVKIALTRIFKIDLKKTIQVCDQPSLNDNIKVNKLTWVSLSVSFSH